MFLLLVKTPNNPKVHTKLNNAQSSFAGQIVSISEQVFGEKFNYLVGSPGHVCEIANFTLSECREQTKHDTATPPNTCITPQRAPPIGYPTNQLPINNVINTD